RLWSLPLPASIRKIRVNPRLSKRNVTQPGVSFPFDASIEDSPDNEIRGDVDIFVEHGGHAFAQVEGLSLLTIAEGTPADDRIFFTKTAWDVAIPNAELVVASNNTAAANDDDDDDVSAQKEK